jgi:hypothetical protein
MLLLCRFGVQRCKRRKKWEKNHVFSDGCLRKTMNNVFDRSKLV